jgi:hypothetical protein
MDFGPVEFILALVLLAILSTLLDYLDKGYFK